MNPWTHHDELDAIRRLWRHSHQADELDEARQRLIVLRQAFPYALSVGHELVLVLEELGQRDAAVAQLNELERQFKRLDEETLCRWGKVFKTSGERAKAAGDIPKAIHEFDNARKYYNRAYEVYRGFYPRINELTLEFLQAALHQDVKRHDESQRLLKAVRTQAQEMLANPAVWLPRKDDDDVWAPATQGEAHILAGQWSDAANRYQDALAAARDRQFYADCMREQIEMLLDACRRLGIDGNGPLTDPQAFFSRSPDAPIRSE